ncbi:MAG: hypothetical protein MZV65_35590 [Chromatiales bacterium]|nr:hypothetical protein [Chromatiales bacterium]
MHGGAAQGGPLPEHVGLDRVHGHEPPHGHARRLERHRDRRERRAALGEKLRLGQLAHRAAERDLPRRRDERAVAAQEHDARSILLLGQGLGVVRERRPVVHLEIRAELRRSGDRAVALVEVTQVRVGETTGRPGRRRETPARGVLEVGREDAGAEESCRCLCVNS